MKKMMTKTLCMIVCAASCQLLTASTGKNCSPPKPTNPIIKQVKVKKAGRVKAQLPLFESLLKHI